MDETMDAQGAGPVTSVRRAQADACAFATAVRPMLAGAGAAAVRCDEFRQAIRSALGYAPEVIEPGRLQRFATIGRRHDAAGWCKLFPDLQAGVFGCYRQGISTVWRAHARPLLGPGQRTELARQIARATAERERDQRQRWSANARRLSAIWRECVPVDRDDPVHRYLRHRGFGSLWPVPAALRLHPGLAYWHEGDQLGTFPAMVAQVTAPDGRVMALHRTYLTSDGRKAAVPAVRKLTATAGPVAGAAIALHPAHSECVGIAEGIETALAAWCGSSVPTFAAYCATSLAAWVWPATARRIVVFADADMAGRESADSLRARALAAGVRCDVLTPSTPGADWCDVWAADSDRGGSK